MRKYRLPKFLEGKITPEQYEKWLHRKAVAHARRDRNRGNSTAKNEEYKIAIHKAVNQSEGKDAYTGEELAWSLLSKYNNADSKKGGKQYKRRFALLPSVDHLDDGTSKPDFKICSWRTNDAKSDLSYEEFLDLCKKVMAEANKSFQRTAIRRR